MKLKAELDAETFDWIFVAKGIGIILVVVGHFHTGSIPDYWQAVEKTIYLFHMPLFFILSGYLYSHGKYPYFCLLKKKARRLLWPFFSVATAFFLIKYLAGRVVDLQYPVTIRSFDALLTDPVNSYMPLLWFIHTLFLIFVIYPLARSFLSNPVILILFGVLTAIFGFRYAVFGNAVANMPFFVTGVLLREKDLFTTPGRKNNRHYGLVFLGVFLAGCFLMPADPIAFVIEYPLRLLLGVTGSLFIITASQLVCSFSGGTVRCFFKKALLQTGLFSMTIYLLHPLFESTVRIAFFQIFPPVHVPFVLIAAIGSICGVLFPLIAEKELLRKNRVTKKYLLGLS